MSAPSMPRPPGRNRRNFFAGHLACDHGQFPGADLIAGDPQKARGGRIESRARHEGGSVVHRREVHALVRVSPTQHPVHSEEEERHLSGQQFGKRTAEDGGGLNRTFVEALVELSAQIEIAVLACWKPGEIDRVVGRDEAWHARLDRGLEQRRLRLDDHVPQSLQRRDDAGRTRACRSHLGGAVQVDAGDLHAELLQSLGPVLRCTVADQRPYAGSPFEQSSGDASAEITRGSRHAMVESLMVSDSRGTSSVAAMLGRAARASSAETLRDGGRGPRPDGSSRQPVLTPTTSRSGGRL